MEDPVSVFVHPTGCKEIHREPIQLDLFIPQTYGYQYTVIVTNKMIGMRKVLRFHHGRGYQEKVFGELKSQSQMDYIAVRRLSGNQLYLMTAILAHNLTRELQMRTESKARGTTERRTPLWHFEELATLRHHVLQRAGRFTWPKGKLTLTITHNPGGERTGATRVRASVSYRDRGSGRVLICKG